VGGSFSFSLAERGTERTLEEDIVVAHGGGNMDYSVCLIRSSSNGSSGPYGHAVGDGKDEEADLRS
jgi:hypothetical protein